MHNAEVRHDGFLQKGSRIEILDDAPKDRGRRRFVEDGKSHEHALRVVCGRVKGRHIDARDSGRTAQETAPAARTSFFLPCDQGVANIDDDLLAIAEHKEIEEVGDRFRVVDAGPAADDEGMLLGAFRRVKRQPCEIEHVERVRDQKLVLQ